MWINSEHEPRWEGPPLRWCDAPVYGVKFRGSPLIVVCNRVLRDDGTCSNAHNHVVRPMRGTCGLPSSRRIPRGHACGARLNVDGTCPDERDHWFPRVP